MTGDMLIRGAPTLSHDPSRVQLPNRRRSTNSKRRIRGANVFVTVEYDAAGSPKEVFISTAKTGSATLTLLKAFAQTLSVALQCGTPLAELANSLQDLEESTEKGFDPSLVIAFVFDCLMGKVDA